jgi:lipopolysaccharide cholinephosphotransferase
VSTPAIDTERMQRELLAALRAFDAACRELGLTYWIDGGTLLGAVRHHGPIPWDDDVDVAMLPADVPRFLAEAPALLGPRYTVSSPAEDDRVVPDAKVYVRGTHIRSDDDVAHGIDTADDALFIDVFVADPVSSNALRRRVERRLAWLVTSHAFAAAMAASPLPMSRPRRLRWQLNRAVPARVVRLVDRFLRTAAARRDGTVLGVGRSALCHDVGFPREEIFPLSELDFAGLTVWGPARPHDYLRREYGPDYLTPPPADQRHTHGDQIWFDD